MNEARVALAHLLSQFEFLPSPEELGKPYPDVPSAFRITLSPLSEIRVCIEPREGGNEKEEHHH
jgi:hypothetical protein